MTTAGAALARRLSTRLDTLWDPIRQNRRIQALLGDYDGGPWNERADAWIILAKKR